MGGAPALAIYEPASMTFVGAKVAHKMTARRLDSPLGFCVQLYTDTLKRISNRN